MTTFQATPIWDQMMEERNGREPHEFEGHEEWDSSEEAAAAYARGLEHATSTEVEWFGGMPGKRFLKPDEGVADELLEELRTAKRMAARARNRRRKS